MDDKQKEQDTLSPLDRYARDILTYRWVLAQIARFAIEELRGMPAGEIMDQMHSSCALQPPEDSSAPPADWFLPDPSTLRDDEVAFEIQLPGEDVPTVVSIVFDSATDYWNCSSSLESMETMLALTDSMRDGARDLATRCADEHRPEDMPNYVRIYLLPRWPGRRLPPPPLESLMTYIFGPHVKIQSRMREYSFSLHSSPEPRVDEKFAALLDLLAALFSPAADAQSSLAFHDVLGLQDVPCGSDIARKVRDWKEEERAREE